MAVQINGTTDINRIEPTAYGLPLSQRNKIINGKMEIAQRGTSFPGLASTTYTLDRFAVSFGGTALATVSQQGDVPTSNEFQSSLRVAITTADASIIASDFGAVFQSVEGFNARDLIGRTFTLSFWVRSSKTGSHCIALRNSGNDRSYVAEYIINVANTWEFKVITVSGGLITAGTWNWTNGSGVTVLWSLAAGTAFQTTAGTWQTGNFLATTNQVNCLDTVGNIFAITGVQLEAGPVATPFEHRPYGAELALCQRYYWRFSGISLGGVLAGGDAYSTTLVISAIRNPVAMRAAPTASISGAVRWQRAGGAVIATGAAFPNNGPEALRLDLTASSVAAGQAGTIRFDTSSDYLEVSAEL